MLKPIVSFFEAKFRNRTVSILAAFLIAVVPFFATILFFINQSRILFSDLPSVNEKVNNFASQLMDWLNQQFQLDPETSSRWISKNLTAVLDLPLSLLQEGVQSGTAIMIYAIMVVLITYFLLLYRTAFKNYFLAQIHPDSRKILAELFDQIQKLAKRYLMGQALVILILGFLIGSGLWLIGVPHAYFWGFLAGFLEIIPYVGTTIGVILPFSYMLMVSDTIWQPWAVIGLYVLVQQIEGNLITPNIMGPSIRINPLFIIIGLFLGGFLWGVSGMILALPMLAISKEVFRTFYVFEPISYLMEDGLSRKGHIFLEKFDHFKYRISSLFFKNKEEEKEE
ncbi:MAG: AI-2E family transporter [Maribacter sp.]|nr:AI-2E family transporter [Maribacter sp.]